MSTTPKFGHALKKSHYPASDNDFVPVNHGSFGLPPQCVVDKYIDVLYKDLASPDTTLKLSLVGDYNVGLKAVAQYLNCSYKNLALVLNTTVGVNTILRSFPFKKGDKIALPVTTYGSCRNTVRFLAQHVGIEPVYVQLDFPMLHEDVVAQFEKTFKEHEVKLALFDTVSSVPAVKFPFIEITKLCKKHGVLSLIDGAHSIGLIPIDLGSPDFQPDFYVSNLHKWLQVPRSAAVMYVAPQHHRTIQTMPIGASYVPPDAELTQEASDDLLVLKFKFVSSEFRALGACIPAALKFREEVCGGDAQIRAYCEGLARKAGQLAVEKWPGLTLMENDQNELITSMVTLIVPVETYSADFDVTDFKQLADFDTVVSKKLIENHRTFVMFGPHGKKFCLRLSANVYNEISDYEYAIDAAKAEFEAYFATKQNTLELGLAKA